MSPCGDFRGDGCDQMKSSAVYQGVDKLTYLFGWTSSGKMSQGFAVIKA